MIINQRAVVPRAFPFTMPGMVSLQTPTVVLIVGFGRVHGEEVLFAYKATRSSLSEKHLQLLEERPFFEIESFSNLEEVVGLVRHKLLEFGLSTRELAEEMVIQEEALANLGRILLPARQSLPQTETVSFSKRIETVWPTKKPEWRPVRIHRLRNGVTGRF